jgi:hypothetical protein
VNLPEKLTSCAGIAFVKKAYPFSRAYELAESLCSYAKGVAKNNLVKKDETNYVPSCFSFHKVSASIAGDYEDIQKNELTSNEGIKMFFGPYTVGEHIDKLFSFKSLEELAEIFDKIPSTSIRELIDTMYVSFNDAEKDFNRIIQILKGKGKNDKAEKLEGKKGLLLNKKSSPLFDAHRVKELTKDDSDSQEEK